MLDNDHGLRVRPSVVAFKGWILPMIKLLKFFASAACILASSSSRATADWDHNGSTVAVEVNGSELKIRYVSPRESLSGLVSQGDLLFEGTLDGSAVTGTARVFKRGCAPAHYSVVGAYEASQLTLRGPAPVFEKDGCAIAKHETNQNSELLFRDILSAREFREDLDQLLLAGEEQESAKPADKRYKLRFCNKSNIKAWIALSVREGTPRANVIVGWWEVDAGDCRNLYTGSFATFSSVEFGFWAHGRNGTNRAFWPTRAERFQKNCIGSWKYKRRSTGNYKCRSGEDLHSFGFYRIDRPDEQQLVHTTTLEGTLDYGAPQVSRAPPTNDWAPSAADVASGLATGLAIGNLLFGGSMGSAGSGGGGGYQQPIPNRRAPGNSGISQSRRN